MSTAERFTHMGGTSIATLLSLEEAQSLAAALDGAKPHDIVAAAIARVGRDHLAAVSSFGAESAALLKIVADVDPQVPVIFLDTGWLFDETLAYRDRLTQLLGLKDVRTIKPNAAQLAARDAEDDLWSHDTDACCTLRKVEPLADALAPFAGWINGRKRFQAATRADIPAVEYDNGRFKFNPLANVTPQEIGQIYRDARIPPHPMVAQGFLSIGCMPCTSRTQPGEDPRAGRWRGQGKVECGIHVAKKPSTP